MAQCFPSWRLFWTDITAELFTLQLLIVKQLMTSQTGASVGLSGAFYRGCERKLKPYSLGFEGLNTVYRPNIFTYSNSIRD